MAVVRRINMESSNRATIDSKTGELLGLSATFLTRLHKKLRPDSSTQTSQAIPERFIPQTYKRSASICRATLSAVKIGLNPNRPAADDRILVEAV